jgi:integrase
MRSTDRAALGCAVYAGLRLGELPALDVAAVDLEEGWLYVHRSWDRGAKEFVSVKNRKPRKVPIIEKLAVLLADHFVPLDHPAEGLLFRARTDPTGPSARAFFGGARTRAGRTPGSRTLGSTRLVTPTQASLLRRD